MSTDFGPLFVQGLEKHFYLEWDQLPTQLDEVFHMDTMSGRYLDRQLWEPYGLFKSRRPLDPIAQDSVKVNFSKRYIPTTLALGDTVSEEDWQDDRYGVLHRMLPAKGGMLARSYHTTREKLGFKYFGDYGYVSGNNVYGSPDGVCLFSTAHPVSLSQKATTVSNRPTTDIDLGLASASAARTNLLTQLGPNNIEIMPNRIRAVVVNPSIELVARQVFKNPMEFGASSNNKNYLTDENVKIIVSPYFQKSGSLGANLSPAANNAWFVLGQTHHLNWFDRTKFQMKSDYDVGVLAYVFVAFCRWCYGYDDWRGTYGSLGS